MDPLQLILARNFNLWTYACAILNEETAVTAAKAWLLIPARTPRCPTCRGPMSRETKMSYKLKYRLRCWRCAREGRPSIRSPLKNTFFERAHVSVLNTLRLMVHFLRKDKVSQAAKDVGVTKKTAIQTYHYLREVCEVAEAHDRDLLGGSNDVVEIDETHLYTRKYHRGRLLRRQTWSFGCISRLTRQIHVELIPNKARTTLDPIVEANVRTGSYIMSDMHRAYNNIHLRLGMRGHSAVNHSLNFVGGTVDIPVDTSLGVPAPGGNVKVKIHTNTLERQWLELKRHCRTCRSQRRLKWYMGEYMYRHNILRQLPSDAARFRRLLRDMHRVYPGLGKRGIKSRNCRCSSPNCRRRN
ncbi:uncharacterized protein LOC111351411 [Spodoptera litura]|uniref:Uncharacterized protein LOC111351411 n=1 Tax=Spodoptera litura TaxID=69820 RepID=A0A9J7DXG3_SPOLT|nr:uncharacterized protein LOC111351411 [Spodoptera litura]